MPENALIVDNDFFFVKFLGNLLRERGFDVRQAYDGKQGILALKDRMVNYIFVNILMPRIDGKQFIDFVREKYANKEFSIIGMSDSIIEMRELQKEAGADYYLQKQPVERMANYLDRFMKYVEGDPFLSSPNKNLFDHEKLFRRQATVDLLESLSFQQGIVESAGMGVIVAEKDARIVFANRPALEILNKPISKLLSSRVTDVFPADEKKKILTGLKAVAKDTALLRQSFAIILNNIAVQVMVSLLRVDGEIEGWVLILNNMDYMDDIH